MSDQREKNEQEWRKLLTEEQYRITRESGTEPPFSGIYYANKEPGVYRCICCGSPLFRSDEKYDSGSGWPSFWAPFSNDALEARTDTTHGMQRTEVRCAQCEAHLGHVFPDGPEPSGLRYCINSAALDFESKD
jgi:peptide-methionine (R)-S-oxide reductase